MAYRYRSYIKSEGCFDVDCKVVLVLIECLFDISISLLIWCMWFIKVKHCNFLRHVDSGSLHGMCVFVVMQSTLYKLL